MSVEIKDLSFTYLNGSPLAVPALEGISLKIANGEFIGIMGRTGCGKSTLIQLIAGLLTPDKGSVLIDGEDINCADYKRSKLRSKLGIVFQFPEYQLFETSVEKDVAFALKHSGLSRTEVRERVKTALELLGLPYEEIRLKSPLSLSGGERRKVAIAGVLVSDPDILIFDEPIAGLDPTARDEFLKLAGTLNSRGKTVIIVSHNADALCEYAGRILLLDSGRIIADGSPAEIFSKELGLGLPEAKSIAKALFERGVLPSADITRKAELMDALLAALKAGDAHG